MPTNAISEDANLHTPVAGYDATGDRYAIAEIDSTTVTVSNGVVHGQLKTSSAGGSAGTQYTDGAVAPANPVGTELVFKNGTTMTAVSAANGLPITGSISATNPSVGTSGAAAPASGTQIAGNDGAALRPLTAFISHNTDNQTLPASAYALLGGGVAQIVNPSGTIDRQRGTGVDGIAGVGVATGTPQLAGPPLTTTLGATVTANVAAQSVLVASSANVKIGDIITTSDNVETVEVSAIADATHITALFTRNHANGATLTWYHYNQARDATVGDAVVGTGMGASATYLYNNINGLLEFDRSANGEKDGANGQGTSVAAEYEFNGGGPLLNTGLASGLTFDRARNLQGKGVGTATQNAGGTAGATSITASVAANTNTLQPGQQIRIDRNTGTEESAYVTTNYVPGTAAITLQSALQFTHAAATIEWDVFASGGPGLSGFTATGLGLEEEALYNPVDGKYYIERAATQDAAAGANIVLENAALFNGTTFDRQRAVQGDAQAMTGIEAASDMLWNGASFDRARSVSGDAMTATGLEAATDLLYNGATYDRARSVSGDAMAATGLEAATDMIFNGTTYDRPRGVIGDAQPATGIPAAQAMLWNGATYDRLKGTNGAANVSVTNTNANGQATMGNSAPVTLPSDQFRLAAGDGGNQAQTPAFVLGGYNSGGPVDSTGKPQQLSVDRLRTWQGKNLVSATITSTVAGDTALACTSGLLKTVMPGQLVRLTGGTAEYVKVSEAYAPSSTATSIPLQTGVVNAGNTTATWDAFAPSGPGTAAMLPTGVLPFIPVGYDPNTSLLITLCTASLDAQNRNRYAQQVPGLVNGAGTVDAQRSNIGVTLLAPGAYTTTQTSIDQINYNGRGIKVWFDMTGVSAGPSVTLSINMKDPASGKYTPLLTGAAVTTISTNVYTVYPGMAAVANVSANDILSRTFQVVTTANNANSATYSVGYNIIL